MRTDLSIGHRLAIGLGIILLLLMAGLTYLFVNQDLSSAAQRDFTDVLTPRVAAANNLEQSVFYLSIKLRTYLLLPSAEGLKQLNDSARQVQASLHDLLTSPTDSESHKLTQDLEPLTETYLQAVQQIAAGARAAPISSQQEQQLAQTREASLDAIDRYVQLQRQKQKEALDALSANRMNLRNGFIVISLFIVACFIGVAVLTGRSIWRPARKLVAVADALRIGDYKPALALAPGTGAHAASSRDEMGNIARAFTTAALALERREARLKADAEIATAMSSSLNKEKVGNAALNAIADYLQAEVGVLYAPSAGEQLLPVAHRALGHAIQPVRLGEGIAGHAAQHRQVIVINDIPADTPFAVRLGYDSAAPRSVAVVPIVLLDKLLGVMVLASLRDFHAEAVEFLQAVSLQLAVGLQNVSAHEEIERLVMDLQDRNERIQGQSEELQAQNEEIQAQNEEIQAQQEELQAQNEELQAQNEEIQKQNAEVRSRSEELETLASVLRGQAATLAETDTRKSEFLATLAHELRNPMAALTLSLEVIHRAEPGSEQAERARDVVKRQVGQLIRLIDDLLDVTRISEGKLLIQRERLDLVPVVQACLEDQRPFFTSANLELQVELPKEPVWVEGDQARLYQIVSNILHNASKFTHEGGEVSLRLFTVAEKEALICVSDDGMGIEPALLPDLFEPFKQGSMNLARSNSGLGLGLTLVKSFAEKHGGTVEALSDGPGKGAEFTVRLPLYRGEAAILLRPQEEQDLRSWRILIAEDNSFVAWAFKETLELDGQTVEIVSSGRDVLEKAKAFAPQVILCDIGLPDLDGYGVAQLLTNDADLSKIPLVAVSGYASPSDRARSAEAGFRYHLVKPLDMSRLRAVLREIDAQSDAPRMDGVGKPEPGASGEMPKQT